VILLCRPHKTEDCGICNEAKAARLEGIATAIFARMVAPSGFDTEGDPVIGLDQRVKSASFAVAAAKALIAELDK
jgi:hypothetical protein